MTGTTKPSVLVGNVETGGPPAARVGLSLGLGGSRAVGSAVCAGRMDIGGLPAALSFGSVVSS
jgi:hypothetical protein